ncbi:MAG TPA: TonB family protein [Nitrospirota bacterium]|nr:TonB family protein [Nitrospirota bacterium]
MEQKIGQSSHELVLSVFLSFFLHAALIVIALILYTTVSPKVYVPPVYEVKLVGQPAMVAPASAPPSAPQVAKPAPAPVEKKAEPKPKAAEVKPPVKALKKGDMPELSLKKTKPSRDEDTKPIKREQVKPAAEQSRPAPKETTTAPNASSEGAAPAAGRTAGIAVSTASGDSRQLSSYAQIVRDCIERNWNPPPGIKGMRAKVSFKVLRTGRLFGDVNIEESSGNTYFDMAAKRAILSSSPFPSMPEEFYKQYAEFSVDVQEKN